MTVAELFIGFGFNLNKGSMDGVLESIKTVTRAAQGFILALGVSKFVGMVEGAAHAGTEILALSKQFGIPVIDLEKTEVSENVVKMVPLAVARRFTMIPIRESDGILTIAIADPTLVFDLKEVKLLTGCEIDPHLACEF